MSEEIRIPHTFSAEEAEEYNKLQDFLAEMLQASLKDQMQLG